VQDGLGTTDSGRADLARADCEHKECPRLHDSVAPLDSFDEARRRDLQSMVFSGNTPTGYEACVERTLADNRTGLGACRASIAR